MESYINCPHCNEDVMDSGFELHRIGCEVKQIREKFNKVSSEQKMLLEKIHENEMKKYQILQENYKFQEEVSQQLQEKIRIERERDRLIRERLELQTQKLKLIYEKKQMEELNTRFKIERDRLLIENKKIMIQILQLTIQMQSQQYNKSLNEEQIKRFPTIVYQRCDQVSLSQFQQKQSAQQLDSHNGLGQEQDKTCLICLEEFQTGDNIKFLGCIHKFHENCCDKWLEMDCRCPCCKEDMIKYLENEESYEELRTPGHCIQAEDKSTQFNSKNI